MAKARMAQLMDQYEAEHLRRLKKFMAKFSL